MTEKTLTALLPVKVDAPADAWTGSSATIDWSAPGAAHVRLEVTPAAGEFENSGWLRLVSGSLSIGPLVAPEYRVSVTAEYADGTQRRVSEVIRAVNRWTYRVSRLLGFMTLAAVAVTIVLLNVLPDQPERTGIGAIVRTLTAVTGALGALALLPILASSIASGRLPFARLLRLLPTRLGLGFAAYAGVCLGLVTASVYLIASSQNLLVLNETDADVYFTRDHRFVYLLPKGMSSLRPRRDIRALLAAPQPGNYIPPRVRPSVVGDQLRLRCVDEVRLVAPTLKEAALVIDGKAYGSLAAFPDDSRRHCGAEHCNRYVFELVDKDCASSVLRGAAKITLVANYEQPSLSATILQGDPRPREEVMRWITVSLESIRVPWLEEQSFSARNETVTITGTCKDARNAADRHATCRFLATSLSDDNDYLHWSFPASDQQWNAASDVDPATYWRLLFKRSLQDMRACKEAGMRAGCPFLTRRTWIEEGLQGTHTVQFVGDQWSFAWVTKPSIADGTAYALAPNFETKLWDNYDRTAPPVTARVTDAKSVLEIERPVAKGAPRKPPASPVGP
jgi:hypothetical protein